MSIVRYHLDAMNVPYEIVPHVATTTALEEARESHLDPHLVVKTVVFATRNGFALAVVPATERVDVEAIRSAVGDPHARLATEDELRRSYPDIELAAFPPLGTVLDAYLFVDPEVLRHPVVAFADGSVTCSVRMRTDDLIRSEMVRPLRLIERPATVAV